MARETSITPLDTRTTRRRVLATGTKLAYAAPVVAASFRLSVLGAGAEPLSDPACGVCIPFFTASTCEGDRRCVCYLANSGGPQTGFCHRGQRCATTTPCPNGVDDCPAGHACSTSTCCGEAPVCIQPCFPFVGVEEEGGGEGWTTPAM
jgi:hypothetical protein